MPGMSIALALWWLTVDVNRQNFRSRLVCPLRIEPDEGKTKLPLLSTLEILWHFVDLFCHFRSKASMEHGLENVHQTHLQQSE